MRRFLALGLIGVTAACASSSGSPTPVPVTQRVLATDEQGAHMTNVLPNTRIPVAAPPAKVLSAVATVYPELGLPQRLVDSAGGRVGHPSLTLIHQLGKAPLSRFINCGSTITGPRADADRVTPSVITTVHPDGKGGSELETALRGESRSVEGTSTDRATCTSTGVLEAEIARAVAERLGS
ncbi:MAG: hypothetical protein ACT4PM_00630 [Gemmatimonadales bacterium]